MANNKPYPKIIIDTMNATSAISRTNSRLQAIYNRLGTLQDWNDKARERKVKSDEYCDGFAQAIEEIYRVIVGDV